MRSITVNCGCPISRVLCEKWGFLPHVPKTTKAALWPLCIRFRIAHFSQLSAPLFLTPAHKHKKRDLAAALLSILNSSMADFSGNCATLSNFIFGTESSTYAKTYRVTPLTRFPQKKCAQCRVGGHSYPTPVRIGARLQSLPTATSAVHKVGLFKSCLENNKSCPQPVLPAWHPAASTHLCAWLAWNRAGSPSRLRFTETEKITVRILDVKVQARPRPFFQRLDDLSATLLEFVK